MSLPVFGGPGGPGLGMIRTPPDSKRRARIFDPVGIEGRIFHIRRLIKESLQDTEISRGLAGRIVMACPRRDGICEVDGLWHFAFATAPDGLPNIRYTRDIDGADTFQSARASLTFRVLDCDDWAILCAALAAGIGFPTKCRITANPGEEEWAHIYPMIGIPWGRPTRWWPMDWTLGYNAYGVHPPQAKWVEFDGKHVRYSPAVISSDDYEPWLG